MCDTRSFFIVHTTFQKWLEHSRGDTELLYLEIVFFKNIHPFSRFQFLTHNNNFVLTSPIKWDRIMQQTFKENRYWHIYNMAYLILSSVTSGYYRKQ